MILKQMILLVVAGLLTVSFVFSCSIDNNENGLSSNSVEKNSSSFEFISSSSENRINSSSSRFIVPALLEPAWPYRNIKVSSIKDFTVYISTLDQPELDVSIGKERIILDSLEEMNGNCEFILTDFMDMSAPSKSGNGYLLGLSQKRDYSSITKDCKYIWKIEIGMSDMSVPFILDATSPVIELYAERDTISPNYSSNLARFKTNENLKFAVFLLKKGDTTLAVAKFSNIIAPIFGIWLKDFKNISDNQILSILDDGKHEIVAYVFDGSTASREQYNLLNKVANGETAIFDLLDNGNVKYTGMNFSMKSDTIIVDSKKLESSSSSYSSSSSSSFMSLNYGGRRYRIVVIGEQTWMAENLNYETVSGSSCYGNEKSGCDKYGRLYDWATAMNIDPIYNNILWNGNDVKHQGICPESWHLPSSKEWNELIEYTEGYSIAGAKLKSTSGWNAGRNGTDDYGFSALPGGLYTSKGNFSDAGYFGYWWSASEGDFIEIVSERISKYDNINIKKYGHSVRCVKD